MPREQDEKTLAALRHVFSDPASNVVTWTATARTGGYRSDEGVESLLPELPLAGAQAAIKEAIVQALDDGYRPTRTEAPGDAEMGLDPAVFHEFRIEVEGRRLYMKVRLYLDDPDEPEATVISVKKAWD